MYTYTFTYTNTCIHIRLHIQIHVYIYVYRYKYIYTYIPAPSYPRQPPPTRFDANQICFLRNSSRRGRADRREEATEKTAAVVVKQTEGGTSGGVNSATRVHAGQSHGTSRADRGHDLTAHHSDLPGESVGVARHATSDSTAPLRRAVAIVTAPWPRAGVLGDASTPRQAPAAGRLWAF